MAAEWWPHLKGVCRMKMTYTAGLLAALAVTAAQAATPVATSAAAQAKPAANSPDEVICHTQHVTGSLLMKRVCLTRREWDQAQQIGREAVRGLQSRGDLLRNDQMGNGGH